MLVLLTTGEVRGAEASEVLLRYTQSCLLPTNYRYLLTLGVNVPSQPFLRPDPSHNTFHEITWAFLRKLLYKGQITGSLFLTALPPPHGRPSKKTDCFLHLTLPSFQF